MAEAAAVSLEAQGHAVGISLQVEGSFRKDFEVHWDATTDDTRRSHADPKVAVEYGAYGLACLLMVELTPHKFIERSYSPSGFDIWLGEKDVYPFQNKARMEVSGIAKGSASQIKARVKEKLEQTNPSDKSGLPAYVVVIEFGKPIAKVAVK